jgi:hypothetical protein
MKTTGLMGAVQVIHLLFGLIRNKLIPLHFGTAGLGVWSIYLPFTELVKGASKVGLDKSCVKK